MTTSELTRDQRLSQLQLLATTEEGKQEINRLYHACFPLGQMPPVGTLIFQTILDYEYGPESP